MKTSKKKILILSTSLQIGKGPEKIAANFGSLLERNNYVVYFLVLYDLRPINNINKNRYYCLNEKFYPKLNESKIQSIFRKFKRLFISILFLSSFRIYSFIRKYNIDSIISYKDETTISMLIAAIFLRNRKFIVAKHDNFIFKRNLFDYIIFNLLPFRILYRFATTIIPISRGIYSTLLAENARGKMKIIFNPHDLNLYRKLAKKKLNENVQKLISNKFVFISIGSLIDIKGYYYLIRSFKLFLEKDPNSILLIIGEGELKQKLQDLIQLLDISKSVYLLGLKQNIFKYLKNSNCFLCSSLQEGLPSVIIEALSLNIPIISTDCWSGPREILCPELKITQQIKYPYYGKYGILIKPFDSSQIKSYDKIEPFSDEEKMFADQLYRFRTDFSLQKRYTNGNGFRRAEFFSNQNILSKWKKIL